MKVLKIFKSLLYRILILVLIGSLGACSEECGYDSHAGYQLGKQNFVIWKVIWLLFCRFGILL